MNREMQDMIFERNAHIRQKIWGFILALVSLGMWVWLTAYDVKLIWWGTELFPMACIGFWLMLTERNIPWEWMWEEDESMTLMVESRCLRDGRRYEKSAE